MTGSPGPTIDQEALQEDFLDALQALGGSAGNGRLRELLTWEEAPYEAVKASLLASGQLRPGRGRGGSVSLAAEAGDEGADGSTSEAAGSFAEAGGSVATAEGSIAAAALGKASALSAPPRASAHAAAGPSPLGPQPSGKQNLSAFIWSVADLQRGDYKQSDYGFEEAEQGGKPISRIFRSEDFGYRTITVERPLRDEAGNKVLGQRGNAKGQPQADSSLRDTKNVPLSEDVQTYFEREVLPHVSDAWVDHEKTKLGYEIPFNRHFYVFTPPRPLEVIDAELKRVTDRILAMIGGLSQPIVDAWQLIDNESNEPLLLAEARNR